MISSRSSTSRMSVLWKLTSRKWVFANAIAIYTLNSTPIIRKFKNMDDENEKSEKVCGYLELKSRLNFFRRWKKYWFVLDAKTLFYFKSKEKYERLGRCKGSINMSLAQAVHPCTISRSYPLEIVTRTKTVVLSACDEENRQKWLRALLNSLHLPEISAPIMRRLTSRISGFVADDETGVNEKCTRASTSENRNDSFRQTPLQRTLYEEIVEEVVLLTGRRLLHLESNENQHETKRQSQRPTPPKPPRVTRKSSYRCTLEVELKTDDNSEMYESANESCYITAESSSDSSSGSSSSLNSRTGKCAPQRSLSLNEIAVPERVLLNCRSLNCVMLRH